MNLIVVNPYDNNIIDKIENFQKEKNIKLEYLDYLKKISKSMKKEEFDKEKENSIIISETIIGVIKEKVNNLCYLKGTKDNKLIELNIINLKDGDNENNRDFVKGTTDYAFSVLDAETITVFSNNLKDQTLLKNGYEALGEYNGANTYVRDKVKVEEMGNRSK